MSSMHKPRRIWLWFRVLAVVTVGLLALPLLSTAAGADGGYDGPSQPVGTQGAVPQQDGGAGASATSDSTTTTSDSLSTDLSGQVTGSADTAGTGPASEAPTSMASVAAADTATASETSASVADNKIVVRKHADTVTGKLIDTATFQLWKDVNANGILDTPSASTPSTSTASTASSVSKSSSAASPSAAATPVASLVSTSGGTYTWPPLAAGAYIVQEVAAPSGYQLPSANDSPVEFPSGSPAATRTVDFADAKLSTSPTGTATATATTSTPGTGAASVAPPAGTTTGGGTLPGVGAPAYLLLAALVGVTSLAGGGWLLSRRGPRGTHAQP